MAEYTYSSKAKIDQRELYLKGLLDFGERQADKFLMELLDVFELLADNPDMGTDFVVQGHTFQKWTKSPYVVYYTQQGHSVHIARIFPGRTNYLMNLTLDVLEDD